MNLKHYAGISCGGPLNHILGDHSVLGKSYASLRIVLDWVAEMNLQSRSQSLITEYIWDIATETETLWVK